MSLLGVLRFSLFNAEVDTDLLTSTSDIFLLGWLCLYGIAVVDRDFTDRYVVFLSSVFATLLGVTTASLEWEVPLAG